MSEILNECSARRDGLLQLRTTRFLLLHRGFRRGIFIACEIARRFADVRLGIFIACETERRAGGASRVLAVTFAALVRPSAARAALRGTSPLPHLLQRAEPVRPWLSALLA